MTTKTKLTLQNIFGVLLLICSLPMFTEGGKGIIGAIILIAGGLICVPKTRRIIEHKYNFQFSKPAKYIAVIFAFFSIGFFSKPTPPHTTNKNSVNTLYSTSPNKNETPLPSESVANAAVTQSQTTETKPEEVKENLSIVQSKNTSTSSRNVTTQSNSSLRKKSKNTRNGYGNSNTSGRSGYIRGPRGGCYYINSNGKKVYVDHSYCN